MVEAEAEDMCCPESIAKYLLRPRRDGCADTVERLRPVPNSFHFTGDLMPYYTECSLRPYAARLLVSIRALSSISMRFICASSLCLEYLSISSGKQYAALRLFDGPEKLSAAGSALRATFLRNVVARFERRVQRPKERLILGLDVMRA